MLGWFEKEGREETEGKNYLTLKERQDWADEIEGYYMAGEGGKSHAKVVIVAGSWGTKGIMSQDWSTLEERLYKSQTLLITVKSIW